MYYHHLEFFANGVFREKGRGFFSDSISIPKKEASSCIIERKAAMYYFINVLEKGI